MEGPGSVSDMTESEGADGLVAFLRTLGATEERLEDARRDSTLERLPTELILSKDADLCAEDMAVRSGVSVDQVLELWRMLGISVPDGRSPMFSERDASFTTLATQFKPVGSHADELLRVLGAALARVAEAAISLYIQTAEPKMDTSERDVVLWAKDLAETTALALKIGDSLGTIFAHHLSDAIDRQRVAQLEVADRSLFRLAVGFVDLVGFTPLAQHTAPPDLLGFIGGFEARAFDVATRHHGRIVKHIGDEVMFVALDASAGCAIARDLTHDCSEGIEPRGGVAFGDVITRHGDYYGPVVNLAARLADLAIPREVLVDAATVSAGNECFAFRPAGNRLLKGFDRPIEVFSLADACE